MTLELKELSNYMKHSNQTHPSLRSISAVTYLLFHSFSIHTENKIGDEGVIKLSEALKSNTCLYALDLSGSSLVAVHSHSM
jgi:hypothetical protein